MWVCVIRMLFAFGSSLLFGLPVIFDQTAQQQSDQLYSQAYLREIYSALPL